MGCIVRVFYSQITTDGVCGNGGCASNTPFACFYEVENGRHVRPGARTLLRGLLIVLESRNRRGAFTCVEDVGG